MDDSFVSGKGGLQQTSPESEKVMNANPLNTVRRHAIVRRTTIEYLGPDDPTRGLKTGDMLPHAEIVCDPQTPSNDFAVYETYAEALRNLPRFPGTEVAPVGIAKGVV
jgi:hypothetical protein